MFHFASKEGYYLSAAFIQERPLIEHIRYIIHACAVNVRSCTVIITLCILPNPTVSTIAILNDDYT